MVFASYPRGLGLPMAKHTSIFLASDTAHFESLKAVGTSTIPLVDRNFRVVLVPPLKFLFNSKLDVAIRSLV